MTVYLRTDPTHRLTPRRPPRLRPAHSVVAAGGQGEGDTERNRGLLTSDRPVDDWGKLLGDTPAITAMLDRLRTRGARLFLQGPCLGRHGDRHHTDMGFRFPFCSVTLSASSVCPPPPTVPQNFRRNRVYGLLKTPQQQRALSDPCNPVAASRLRAPLSLSTSTKDGSSISFAKLSKVRGWELRFRESKRNDFAVALPASSVTE
jgi:hypothetical protein